MRVALIYSSNSRQESDYTPKCQTIPLNWKHLNYYTYFLLLCLSAQNTQYSWHRGKCQQKSTNMCFYWLINTKQSTGNWFENTERYSICPSPTSWYQFGKTLLYVGPHGSLYCSMCVWVFRGQESMVNSQRRLFWSGPFPYWVDLNETEPRNSVKETDSFF